MTSSADSTSRKPNRAPNRALSRSAARLAAVQALFQHDMDATPVAQLLHEFHQHRLGTVIDEEEFAEAEYADAEVAFFDDLVQGTLARLADVDAIIAANLSEKWTLARLDRTMKAILRVGTYELIARVDVPPAAAISEYVEVAKAFDAGRETGFVNGLLDAVAKGARR